MFFIYYPFILPLVTHTHISCVIGQTLEINLPSLDFELQNDALPLQLTINGSQPILCIRWGFKFAFGFDETDGFFIYTFPDEGDEFFIRADFSLEVDNVQATLLFFLALELNDIDINFGAGIFVGLDKESALRLGEPDDENSVQFGRIR